MTITHIQNAYSNFNFYLNASVDFTTLQVQKIGKIAFESIVENLQSIKRHPYLSLSISFVTLAISTLSAPLSCNLIFSAMAISLLVTCSFLQGLKHSALRTIIHKNNELYSLLHEIHVEEISYEEALRDSTPEELTIFRNHLVDLKTRNNLRIEECKQEIARNQYYL